MLEKAKTELEGWEIVEEQKLRKTYQFKGFLKTMSFVNAVAWQANKLMHHPDMEVSFNKCEIFELGSGVNFSINEIADMYGKDYSIEYIEKRSGEYDVTLCDYTLANKVLRWKPTRNVKDYIQSFVETERFLNE